jgi:hypothetical protein
MSIRLLFPALFAALIASSSVLNAQQSDKLYVCKDGHTVVDSGTLTCTKHNGIDQDKTREKNAKTGAEKVGATTERVVHNTGKAVSKGAEDVGKGAKAVEKEAAGDVTNATADGATAKCKDGTFSHAHQHDGACAKHGGVEAWMDGKP